MHHLLDRMVEIADRAGEIALKHFGRTHVSYKPDHSVLTEADPEVQSFLQNELSALLPEAAFIGEEGQKESESLKKAIASEYVWIVDPIDGTGVFSDGLETFCVCVGLFRHGKPYAGVVNLPALHATYKGQIGEGAFYNDIPIRAATDEEILQRSAIYAPSKSHLAYKFHFNGKIRSLGSTALHYLLVAKGAGIAGVSAAHIWDYAAIAPILQEAGGQLKHLDGKEIVWTDWYGGGHIIPPLLGASETLWKTTQKMIEPTFSIKDQRNAR